MIPTILHTSWLGLKRDRVALGLTFVLPIVFFSIFAVIFGGVAGGGDGDAGVGAMTILAVDEDGSNVSGRFIASLGAQSALEVVTAPEPSEDDPEPAPYTARQAHDLVRGGSYPACIVVPAGFGAQFGDFGAGQPAVELIYDPANPLARHAVAGLVQAAAMTAAPDVLVEKGIGQLEANSEMLTPKQRSAVDQYLSMLREQPAAGAPAEAGPGGEAPVAPAPAIGGLVEVEAISARATTNEGDAQAGDADGSGNDSGNGDESGKLVSYYAAGIGVMFLLFSMAGGAGSLLEEEESGTLERVLSSRARMGTLLAGHWLFFSIVGLAQLAVMFLWGALVHGLDLFVPRHLAGFLAMSAVTAPAAAAFGTMLATICRSRAQLSGLSTIVILIMSALGGSMVPRFVMPDFMNTTALFTFNGWALDGYLKVFWYDDPAAGIAGTLAGILPQIAVLAGLTAVFLLVARLAARRWEAV